jgi:hypothetical protein
LKRQDTAYWSRLRVDRASALAVGLTLIACIAALLGLLGLIVGPDAMHGRGSPAYWLVLLPFAWWGASLAGYEPGAVRLLQPAMLTAPLAAAVALALAWAEGRGVGLWLLSTLTAVVTASAGMLCYGRSLLKREGPAR